MKSRMLLPSLMMLICVGVAAAQTPAPAPAPGRGPAGPGLTLSSPAFEDGGIIPNKYTQADPNPVSPRLVWTNVPANTVTFALIFHDPDVAIQRRVDDVLHGMWFNIPGAAGPYHHYTFELFALDTKLELGPDATRADVLNAMNGHILGKGVLVGRFHR